MAKNNQPAFSRPASEYTKSGSCSDGNDAICEQDGLTKREYAAIKILAGMTPYEVGSYSQDAAQKLVKGMAESAVLYADALFEALDK